VQNLCVGTFVSPVARLPNEHRAPPVPFRLSK
jgi:hypothetical protein